MYKFGALFLLGGLLLPIVSCTPAKKGSSKGDSVSRNIYLNGVDDFCLYAPMSTNTIGETEAEVVAYCTTDAHGTRVMPEGTLKGVHFVKTPNYVQVTGVGDFTKINIKKGDDGGELDPHGATGEGNPVGGKVFGSQGEYQEWTNFMSDSQFCIRACSGPDAATYCQHIYDVMGCAWNMPANYDAGTFESCEGDSGDPMGVYGGSTWYQGQNPTPSAHPAPKSSNCAASPSPKAKRDVDAAFYSPAPTPTPKN